MRSVGFPPLSYHRAYSCGTQAKHPVGLAPSLAVLQYSISDLPIALGCTAKGAPSNMAHRGVSFSSSVVRDALT